MFSVAAEKRTEHQDPSGAASVESKSIGSFSRRRKRRELESFRFRFEPLHQRRGLGFRAFRAARRERLDIHDSRQPFSAGHAAGVFLNTGGIATESGPPPRCCCCSPIFSPTPTNPAAKQPPSSAPVSP